MLHICGLGPNQNQKKGEIWMILDHELFSTVTLSTYMDLL